MENKVLPTAREAARLTALWHKKQIAFLGGAIMLVARQQCRRPIDLLFDVKEWIDDFCNCNHLICASGKGGDRDAGEKPC